ncbi:2'-5' RNA ligase family protein [Actinoplanes sp. RD1]|uniref:2'-5' RNA ligase family protein n=1 Tax=Actinoplanes sp. RD1 TaxID=3064538 RepID=UPI0027429551|nr:2'-5' RNA ligase family protein [Actinoplanes sp. RD1]
MIDATQTALIVVVPEAEATVGPHRAALDRAAAWGVPAHVTVLYPFLPPDAVDDAVLAALRAAIGSVPRFDANLTEVGWFADRVVWLAPRPAQPFRDLTAAVWSRFPQAPPYTGEFAEVVPHLTIGHDADRAVLNRAAAEVTAGLPISFEVETVRLIAGTPGRRPWRSVTEIPLGPAV